LGNDYLPGNLAKSGFENESRTGETKVLDFSFKNGLVGASNYDKEDCTIEGVKQRIEQTKKKRD